MYNMKTRKQGVKMYGCMDVWTYSCNSYLIRRDLDYSGIAGCHVDPAVTSIEDSSNPKLFSLSLSLTMM